MKIGLEVWSSDVEQVLSTCRLAESLGIDAFYYGESPHDLNLDCWTTLGVLAASTERIRLGPVITNILPSYRSSMLLAKQAATVAAFSGDRLDFRTGVGAAATFARPWWEPFGIEYPNYEQRLTHLEEALTTMRQLWDTSHGAPQIPITMAARGERAMRLAATQADVWETSFCTPDEFEEQRKRMLDLLAGGPITCSLEIDGFVASTRPGVDDLLAQLQADRGSTEDLEPVLDRALVGLPEEAAAHLDKLAAAGVEQVLVALHDPHDADAVKSIAAAMKMHRDSGTTAGPT